MTRGKGDSGGDQVCCAAGLALSKAARCVWLSGHQVCMGVCAVGCAACVHAFASCAACTRAPLGVEACVRCNLDSENAGVVAKTGRCSCCFGHLQALSCCPLPPPPPPLHPSTHQFGNLSRTFAFHRISTHQRNTFQPIVQMPACTFGCESRDPGLRNLPCTLCIAWSTRQLPDPPDNCLTHCMSA
eukprot:295073-Chlamydomonas_euryale.AAC.1